MGGIAFPTRSKGRARRVAVKAPVLLVAGLFLGMASYVYADVFASDPNRIRSEMQEEGYLATMDEDSEGDPMVRSKVSKSSFQVLFYGCNDAGKDCTSLQFNAGYNLTDALEFSVTNAWNRRQRFGKAYLDDEGDPFLKMEVNLAGGVSEENFRSDLERWRRAIEAFEEHIDWD